MAELQRPDVSNDGPAVRRRNLRRIAEHGAESVRDYVVQVAIGNLPQARITSDQKSWADVSSRA